MTELEVAGPDTRPELSRISLAHLALFYRERFAMSVAANVAYRGAVAIWIFVTLIQPLVFIVVWRTVAGSGETGGYTANLLTLVVFYAAAGVLIVLFFRRHVPSGDVGVGAFTAPDSRT